MPYHTHRRVRRALGVGTRRRPGLVRTHAQAAVHWRRPRWRRNHAAFLLLDVWGGPQPAHLVAQKRGIKASPRNVAWWRASLVRLAEIANLATTIARDFIP